MFLDPSFAINFGGIDVSSSNKKRVRGYLNQISTISPYIAPIVNHQDHPIVRREYPIQFLSILNDFVIVPRQDSVVEEPSVRVEYFDYGVGVAAGSHGVDVELEYFEELLEEVTQTRSQFDVINVRGIVQGNLVDILKSDRVSKGPPYPPYKYLLVCVGGVDGSGRAAIHGHWDRR